MAIPTRTRSLLAQLLSSESFERLHVRTAKAVHALAGKEHVVRFFHDPESPMSWLTAQALLQLQNEQGFSVVGHTLFSQPSDGAGCSAVARQQRHLEAVQVARWHGLKPPERVPEQAQVETVAGELFEREGNDDWLEAAVNLGNALFCSTSIPDTMQDLRPLQRNQALLEQLGHRRGSTVFTDGLWFTEVDGVIQLQEHFERLGLPCVTLFQTHPEALPDQAPSKIRFWFRVGDPYCYLAFKTLDALSVSYGIEIELLPTANTFENDELSLRRQATAMMEVGREARRLSIPFGRVAGDTPTPALKLWEIYFALDGDRDRQRQLLHNAFHAVWVRGMDINDPEILLKVATSVNLSYEQAKALMQRQDFNAIPTKNAEFLYDTTGGVHLPVMEFNGRYYSGHHRSEIFRAILENVQRAKSEGARR